MYGFSAPSSAWNGASASAAAASISACDTAGRPAEAAYPAACSPARRPKTSRSEREFPPSRFEPCMPPATSPAAKSPGTPTVAALSESTAMPPIT
ncbi:hypothetical protein GCM10020254_33240 [Streptomyces goshikiensis]